MQYKRDESNISVRLEDIKLNKENPRKKGSIRPDRELLENLKTVGQINNIIIDENGIILSGNRRYICAKALGWKTIRADIKTNLSKFKKSALLISANSTQLKFNAWESRDAIANIYWNEFLEDYKTTISDKGYSEFSRQLGISHSYIRKIIEMSKPENKALVKNLRKQGVATEVVDEIIKSSSEDKNILTEVALNQIKKAIGKRSGIRQREAIRAKKRRIQNERQEVLDHHFIVRLIDKIQDIGEELQPYILKKVGDNDLKKLQQNININIISFYERLSEQLGV